MTKHKEGYKADCNPPYLNWRWKEGQAWACECGNIFKVGVMYYGADSWKTWDFVK